MASRREVGAIAKRQLALRDHLWPGCESRLWDRKVHDGFTTIPKTMPLVQRAMDEMTKNTPVSSTYLALWCATWDNSFVVLSKPGELASAAGFSGQRAVRTWMDRMRLLQELGFVDIKPGPSGPMSYALILNPHLVVHVLRREGKTGLTETTYNALIERALDIGADDMATPPAEAA